MSVLAKPVETLDQEGVRKTLRAIQRTKTGLIGPLRDSMPRLRDAKAKATLVLEEIKA